MTRPASFNKIWGYETLQIADENNEKTQEFMRAGWEGGSDKKAPSASVQNYHMQKTDQALQEVERQGHLSWRSDVPYTKGARVFFHGNTFHALNDNQDVEPQGSRDNGVWFLIPTQVYPTRYESVEGLGTAAKHNAEDFDTKGAALAVDKSLSSIAKSGKLNDASDVLDKKHGGRGRSDNVTDMQYFDAYGGITTCGFRFSGDDHNKITSGADDTDPEHSGNITLDTWNSFAVRSSINGFKTAWKLCARDGAVYQRGDFRFFGSGEKTISNYGGSALWLAGDNNTKIRVGYNNFDFHNNKGKVLNIDPNANVNFTAGGQIVIKNTTGRVGISSRYGDTLYIDDGNALSFQNNLGQEKFAVHDGAGMFAGGLEVKDKTLMRNGLELYHATPYIDFHYGNNDSDYTARIIASAEDRLQITSHLTVNRDLTVGGTINGRWMGSAFSANVWDTGTITSSGDVPWGASQVPSVGALHALCNNTQNLWGKRTSLNSWDALAGDDQELLTTRQFVDYRNSCTTAGGIGSYVYIKFTGGYDSNWTPGNVVSGSFLESRKETWDSNYPSFQGTWRIHSRSMDKSTEGWQRNVALVSRIN